jgi:hypothetical protein
VAVSFIGGGNPEYHEKTTNLSQATDKLDHSCLPIFNLRWELVLSHDVIETDRMVWLNRFLAHQRLQTSQIVMLHDETKLCVRILIVYFIGKIKIKWRRSITSNDLLRGT